MSLATASLAVCQAPGLTAQSRRQQQQQRRGRAAALVVRAADTPNLSGGLTTTNSSLLGPKPNLGGSLGSGPSLGPKLSTGRPQISLDDVQLKSGVSAAGPARRCLALPTRIHLSPSTAGNSRLREAHVPPTWGRRLGACATLRSSPGRAADGPPRPAVPARHRPAPTCPSLLPQFSNLKPGRGGLLQAARPAQGGQVARG